MRWEKERERLGIDDVDSPGLFTNTSEHICLYFLVLLFELFSFWFGVVD